MKKVAFYGRYSSNNQTEQSIEGQRHVCERYAEAHGLQIVAEYVDRAISGTTDKRPQFQRMISDSERGLFDGILVYKLDRFSRDRYDSAVYKHKLKKRGMRVISATEPITDTPEGILLEAVLEGVDEFYSAELSRKVNRGLSESFHKGYYLKKIAPFGYRIENRRLVPDETTAPIAADIFQRYADGARMVDLVKWLNSIGMTNQKGNPWRMMNVSTHLHNRTYMGEYHYGQFAEPMPVPALVSPELFDTVQQRLDASAKRHRQRSDYDYMLTGHLICAQCGHMVSGSTARENHYYYCRHCERQNRHCWDADTLHNRVTDALAEYICADKVQELADAAFAEYEKEQTVDERPAMEKELKAIEAQLQNAVQAILRGVELDTLTDTIETLKARREALRAAIDDAPRPMPRFTREDFVAILTAICEHSIEKLIDTVVNCIYLRDDGTVLICINLTDENNTPPMEQILFSVPQGEPHHTQNKIITAGAWLMIAA